MITYTEAIENQNAKHEALIHWLIQTIGLNDEALKQAYKLIDDYTAAVAKIKLLDELVWYTPIMEGHEPYILRNTQSKEEAVK